MVKVILLNAPPRSGKDTLADELSLAFYNKTFSFKNRLINIALVVSGVSSGDWYRMYNAKNPDYPEHSTIEWMKDVPLECFGGLSQRQYLIHISESFCKPLHGSNYFGKALAQDIQKSGLDTLCVVSDSGFEDEVKPLLDVFAPEEILVLQWHKKGCTFEGDSRNYLKADKLPKGIKFVDLGENVHGEWYEFLNRAIKVVEELTNEKG